MSRVGIKLVLLCPECENTIKEFDDFVSLIDTQKKCDELP